MQNNHQNSKTPIKTAKFEKDFLFKRKTSKF